MEENNEDTMKILVATDIHLGYNENHPIRGNDSFIAFEEILKHAQNLDVDYLLLGGDLFHDTRPSTSCLDRCITLLRRYCLGDKEIQIEFLSDQSLNFKHCKNPQVNYEDPNYNVAIPVFSVHGNHDDPTGPNKLSALDLLADIGLVNYFGKWTDLTHVQIHPIVISKGETKVAIFGLSHIHDERLSRLFKSHDVEMMRLEDDNIFNLLVLHQNRANRGVKNFIPEEVIPNFIDLVIWGHEHDCRITPESSVNGVQISQPGSSVATSLAEGESLQKHIGLLLVNGTQFEMKNIVLKTVRPFVFKHFDYKEEVDDNSEPQEASKKKAMEIIESMIEEAKNQIYPDETKQPTLPLIRLVFQIQNENQQFNAIRIGQQFSGRVANPEDIILLKKTKRQSKRSNYDQDNEISDNIISEGTFSDHIEKLLNTYMDDHKTPLQVMTIKGLCEATVRFLENNDENAFEDVLQHYSEDTKKKLMEREFDEEQIDLYFQEIASNRIDEEDIDKVQQIFDNPNRRQTTNVDHVQASIELSDDDDDNIQVTTNRTMNSSTVGATRGGQTTRRPRGRGRGSRGPRGRARAAQNFFD